MKQNLKLKRLPVLEKIRIKGKINEDKWPEKSDIEPSENDVNEEVRAGIADIMKKRVEVLTFTTYTLELLVDGKEISGSDLAKITDEYPVGSVQYNEYYEKMQLNILRDEL